MTNEGRDVAIVAGAPAQIKTHTHMVHVYQMLHGGVNVDATKVAHPEYR